MTISAWFSVALAIPVLLLGEFLVRRIGGLSRFNIPAPVVGGLLLSLLVLGGNVSGLVAAKFQTSVSAQWWTWIVTTEPDWFRAPSKNVNLPFLVAFFTCIGLNASWTLVRKGSLQVLSFLALAGVLDAGVQRRAVDHGAQYQHAAGDHQDPGREEVHQLGRGGKPDSQGDHERDEVREVGVAVDRVAAVDDAVLADAAAGLDGLRAAALPPVVATARLQLDLIPPWE
jgi:hypothetical protein